MSRVYGVNLEALRRCLWRRAKFAATLLLPLVAFGPNGARADTHTFSNSFISFRLPDSWDCDLEETEWVCNETRGLRHPAIIIMAAKEAGPDDTLDQYFDHLARPKFLTDDKGQRLRLSVVQSIRREDIGGQTWVASTQFESEIANFYTEYYATVKGNVAVLVTLSAHKTVHKGLMATFRDIVGSLQVFDPLNAGK
jgi:hypothetical protein